MFEACSNLQEAHITVKATSCQTFYTQFNASRLSQ